MHENGREETTSMKEITTPSRTPSGHEDTLDETRRSQVQDQKLFGNQDLARHQKDTTGMQSVSSHVGARSQTSIGITSYGQPVHL